jgi:hypothetical protein
MNAEIRTIDLCWIFEFDEKDSELHRLVQTRILRCDNVIRIVSVSKELKIFAVQKVKKLQNFSCGYGKITKLYGN